MINALEIVMVHLVSFIETASQIANDLDCIIVFVYKIDIIHRIFKLSWYFPIFCNLFLQVGYTCFLHGVFGFTSVWDTSTGGSGYITRTICLIMDNFFST